MGLDAALAIKLGRLDIRFVAVGNSFGSFEFQPTRAVSLIHGISLCLATIYTFFSATITASWVVFSFHFLITALVLGEYFSPVHGWLPCTRQL